MTDDDIKSIFKKLYMSEFPFDEPRLGQEEIIPTILSGIVERDVRCHIIQADTGVGKSAIAVTVARALCKMVHSRAVDKCVDVTLGPIDEEAPIGPIYKSKLKSWKNYSHDDGDVMHTKCILATPNKALQDQYEKEFVVNGNKTDITMFKGRSNYECGVEEVSADKCPIKKMSLKERQLHRTTSCYHNPNCGYGQAIRKALLDCNLVVCNYHSMTSLMFHAEARAVPFSRNLCSVLVVDEAHTLPAHLIDMGTAHIDIESIYADKIEVEPIMTEEITDIEIGVIELIHRIAADPSNKKLLLECVTRLLTDVSHMNLVYRMLANGNYEMSTDFTAKSREYDKLYNVMRAYQEEIIKVIEGKLEQEHTNWSVFLKKVTNRDVDPSIKKADESKPIYHRLTLVSKSPAPGFRELASNFNVIIMMSGTLALDAFRKDLGLTADECEMHKVHTSTPLSYRPLIYIGSAETNMKYANKEKALPVIAESIVDLARFHDTWRGIIHTQSGANGQVLKKHIAAMTKGDRATWRRFIWHFGGPKYQQLKQFMANVNDNSIIVSPSLDSGFDGKNRVARWQVVMKIPYPPRNVPEVKTRLDEPDGEIWYTHEVIKKIVQTYGRVNRTSTDFGITYVIDGGWNGFLWKIRGAEIRNDIPLPFLDAVDAHRKFYYIFKEDGTLDTVPRHEHDQLVLNCSKRLAAVDLLQYLETLR